MITHLQVAAFDPPSRPCM